MRVTSGVDGFDVLVRGGFPVGASVVLQGPPGNEKDVFAYEFLAEGLRSGAAVLIAVSSTSSEQFLDSLSKFGVDVQGAIAANRLKVVDWHSFQEKSVAGVEERGHVVRCSVDLTNVGIALSRALSGLAPDVPKRAVLEILSRALRVYDLDQVYAFAQSSKAKLSRHKVTSLFLLEKEMHDAETLSSVCQPFDGVIDIERRRDGDAIIRKIGVLSLKDTVPDSRFHSIDLIPGKGLRVRATIGDEMGSPISPESAATKQSSQPEPSKTGPTGRKPAQHAPTILQIAEERIRTDPKDADALFAKASALAAMGDLSGAIKTLHALTAISDNYPGLWILRAKLFARRGDKEGAQESRLRAEAVARREEQKARAGETVPCPMCDALVSVEAPECPSCGARFHEEMGLADELDRLGKAAIQDRVREELRVEPETGKAIEREVVIQPRDRVVKPKASVPATPPTQARQGRTNGLGREGLRGPVGRTNGLTNGLRGRTNGLTNGLRGRTNGLTNGLRGRTNGLTNGLVNGLASLRRGMTNGLTNGSGFTNGLGSGRYRREAALGKWKLYVIPLLSAALVLLPLLFPSGVTGPSYPIVIDGDASDWPTSALTSQSRNPEINPNVDLTRFAVADNVDLLAFYVEMGGSALRGGDSPPVLDSVRVFIDADRSPGTGYRVDPLGADRMLEVSGWRGSVNVSTLYEWDSGQDPLDWRGWIQAGRVMAAAAGNRIEIAVDWLAIAPVKQPVFATLHTRGFDGSVDTADFALSSDGGSLVAIQQSTVPEIVAGANVQLLRLDLSAIGGDVTVAGVTVTLTGSAQYDIVQTLRLVDALSTPVDERIPTERRVPFRFADRTIVSGSTLQLLVTAEVPTPNGETIGAFVAGPQDVLAGGASVTVRRFASPRDVGYLGAVLPTPRIDAGFAEWVQTYSDPTADVSGASRPDIDLYGFAAQFNGNTSFFFAGVRGRLFAGTWVPEGNGLAPVTGPSPSDQDRDGVPDAVDPLPFDFNNDGIPDAQTRGDYDADLETDYGQLGGTDVWLNTTLPLSFPAPYGGREVRLYIGPVQEPFRSRDDILRVFVDVDNRSWSGYAIDGIGADRMIELAGASGLVGGATYLGFAGSYPGEWSWLPLSNVSFAMGLSATEFAVGADLGGNTSRFYVEIGDSVGAFDVLGPASRGTRSATPQLTSGVPRSTSLFNAPPSPQPARLPWSGKGPETRATLIDANSNAVSTQYNHQRKVVRAGDVPGDAACDATNSDGCWYAVFYDQFVEATANTAPSSKVKVQNGAATLAAGSNLLDVTITSVNTAKSFLVFGASLNEVAPQFGQVSGQVTSSTNIRFQRFTAAGSSAISLEWYVAEFTSGVAVQRGSTAPGSGTPANVTIASVNLAKSFPIISYRISGNDFDGNDFAKAKITSSTSLELVVSEFSTVDATVEWQIVEYSDASVQRGDVSFATTDTSRTATITSVNAAKSWLLFTYQNPTGTVANIGQKMVRGVVTNPTTLTFDRVNTGQIIDLTWYVVEFTDETSVQSGTSSFAIADTQKDATIACVTSDLAIAAAGGFYYRGGRTPYNLNDNPGVATVTLDLTSSTNLRLTRAVTGSQTADVRWFVVQFGQLGCRVSGTFPTDIQTANDVFIQYRETGTIGQIKAVQNGAVTMGSAATSVTATLSPAVDTTKSFLVFGTSGDTNTPGTGQISGNITDASTVTFQRVTSGVAVTIEWYVAEFLGGVSVQRGNRAMAAVTENVAITSVTLTRSFALISYRVSGTTWGSDDFVKARLTTATNLELTTNAVPGTNAVEWQVIEFTGSNVQTGEISFGTTDSSRTATPSPSVDPTKSWLIVSYKSDTGTGADIGQKMIRGVITDGSTLTFDRSNTGQLLDLTWFLVEFTDGTTTERNTASFSTSETFKDATVSSLSNRIVAAAGLYNRGGRTPYNADDNPGVAFVTMDFTTATNLRLTRALTGLQTADVAWYVITFPSATNYQANVRYDWLGVPAGDAYTLTVKGYRQDENIGVQVLTPPSTWNTRFTISATTNTQYTYSLTSSEYNSGAPSIRFVDAGSDGAQSDFWIDLVVIATVSYWDRVVLVRSSDTSGSTWGSQMILGSGRTGDSALVLARDSAEPSIAIDSAGYLHAVWVSASASGNQNTLNLVRYTRTTITYPTQSELASSANWEVVTSVDDTVTGYMPTVSTDTSNNPHVTWSGSKTGGTVYYKNKAAGTWRATVSWGTSYTGLSVDVSPQNSYVSLVRATGGWWNGDYAYRQRITLTAGTAAVPTSYSVSVTFDHATLVSAGKSQADGDDVRIAYWSGSAWSELDRVLDASSSWNSASTRIWFRTQVGISASGTDNNYYVHYGHPGAASPPADKANVFLFFDDFEAGNLNRWTIASGLWQSASDQARTGTYSMKYPTEAGAQTFVYATPALNEADVYWEGWWRFSDVASMDIAQVFRRPAGVTSNYETDLEGTAGWDIAKVIGGTWSELNPNAGTATANTWTRIAIAIYGTGMRVFKDGTQINPASGSFNVGTELSSGNVGFRKWAVGAGFAWWIDDVAARKYVDPEPTSSLAAEQVNEVQYTVCRDLSTSNCDASTEFTRWDGTAGYDVVASAVETSSYPSLATTYEANGDLWVAYVKNADSTTRAIYARSLDYPSAGWAPEETADSLSGTLFTKPSIGVDSDNNVHALYVATSGPQVYYKSRTGGSWGARTAIDTSSDNPALMVRAPNSPPYGSGQAGGLFWKTTTSETYFHYIPEFETLVLPVTLSVLVMWMWRRVGARRHDRARTFRRPTPNDNQGP